MVTTATQRPLKKCTVIGWEGDGEGFLTLALPSTETNTNTKQGQIQTYQHTKYMRDKYRLGQRMNWAQI